MPDDVSARYLRRAEIGRRLSAVPGMTDADVLGRLVDDLEKQFGLQLQGPRSAQELVFRLADHPSGLRYLTLVVHLRNDLFAADHEAVTKLRQALAEQVEETALVRPEVTEVEASFRHNLGYALADLDDLNLELSPWQVRHAFLATLRLTGLSLPEGPMTVPEAIRYLDEHGGELRAWHILDFLARLEKAHPGLTALTDCLTTVVSGLPALAGELDRIKIRIKRWHGDGHRTHLLIRVLRDIDYEPEEPFDAQQFSFRVWRYPDDSHGSLEPPQSTAAYGDLVHGDNAPGIRLADELAAAIPVDLHEHAVIELMADEPFLSSSRVRALVDQLRKRYAVVTRPPFQCAGDSWFANWRRVLDRVGFRVVEPSASRLDRPAAHPAVIVATQELPAGLFDLLTAAGIPVAAWSSGGHQFRPARFDKSASFKTPTEFHDDLREELIPADAVLMWHNPHWFPDDQGALKWRRTTGPGDHP